MTEFACAGIPPVSEAGGYMPNYAAHVLPETVCPVFQPIENLGTGAIEGFESLARLHVDGTVVPPAVFLPRLGSRDRLRLFCVMVGKAVAFLDRFRESHPTLFVSVNVEGSLVMAPGFYDLLRESLQSHGYRGENLVLELLEGDQIGDLHDMHLCLARIRTLGIAIALDDIGSAYSSLITLRDLPIDIVKLDQSFARGLEGRPEDLHFVLSLMQLARGLGKKLIVEGAETFEIYDALRALGVEYAQGYGVARPMPFDAVADWLDAHDTSESDREPRSMLAAYAKHLLVVETCRVLANQPLKLTLGAEAKDPHACTIGKYFDRCGLHDTDFGRAHKRFHAVMPLYASDAPIWSLRAENFRLALQRAILTVPSLRCDPCDEAAATG